MPVIISSRMFEDPDGHEFAVVTFTDISEQKQAEAQAAPGQRAARAAPGEIEEDLLLAARVQQSLAPQSLVWGGMRVDAYFHPVRTIGGDFGLVSPLDDHHLNLLVCDVSGHGIGSALVANRIYSETMAQLRSGSAARRNAARTEPLRDAEPGHLGAAVSRWRRRGLTWEGGG